MLWLCACLSIRPSITSRCSIKMADSACDLEKSFSFDIAFIKLQQRTLSNSCVNLSWPHGSIGILVVRLFVKRFALCYRTVVCLSVCDVVVLWPNCWIGWLRMPLSMKVGLVPGHTVLDGDPAPPTERGTAAPPPTFRPMLLWPRSPISATAQLLLGFAVANCACGECVTMPVHCGMDPCQ